MRSIFIGSSKEALGQAKKVGTVIQQAFASDIQTQVWNEAFPASSFTYEAIQQAARNNVAAIFVMAADDTTTIREKDYQIPRGNVIFELGFFAAILGRERVVICKYEPTTLPTDLNGITYISMGPYPGAHSEADIDESARREVLLWARGLGHIIDGVPSAQILHGYSGRWHFVTKSDRWFGHDIYPPNYVESRGFCDLIIPQSGSTGYGSIHGEIKIQVEGCHAIYKLSETIEQVACPKDGSLSMKVINHVRQRISLTGDPPTVYQPGLRERYEGRIEQDWKLKPQDGAPKVLSGLREGLSGAFLDSRQTTTFTKLT